MNEVMKTFLRVKTELDLLALRNASSKRSICNIGL
jgi:hypothetical protein